VVLAAHISKFLDRHPEVRLELIMRDHVGDLVADGFDLALRFGDPPGGSHIARKLVETRILTVASPEFVARYGRPKHPSEVEKLRCIDFYDAANARPFDWEFRQGRKILPVKPSARLMVSDVGAMLSACEAGKVVPTWNYAVVHAHGRPEINEGAVWLQRHVGELTAQQEKAEAKPWEVSAPERYIEVMLRGIIGFRFVITRLEGLSMIGAPSIAAGSSTTATAAAQYVSIKYTERLAEAGVEPSVGSVGDSYDNALAETINGLYKAEVIHRRGPWRSRPSRA
jgi:Putative FMN-binding domain/LysR substrate binding domain